VTRIDPAVAAPTAAAEPGDPILLEVLRSRLQAVVDEAALAIEQTAVSPIVAEGKDYSSNVLDAAGGLLVGGGKVEYKYAGARNVVAATIARHAATLAPGDFFAANDPHSGGGNHPQDIEICQPVFVGAGDDAVLVGWIAASAHLVDVGGMTFGSWAPDATECFQEAVRFPPVRLFRAGEQQTDVWDMFLTNVRLPQLVEMDVRGLVAGCHVATRKLVSVVESLGLDAYRETTAALCDAAERVLRDRIRRIADGTYAMDGWVEWGDERYHLPCRLEVTGDALRVDFTGAPGQVPHFVNSKHFIVRGQIVADTRALIGQDLPFCEGLYRPIEVICPGGTIVDSVPPAPIASAHLDVAMNATALATQCLQLALAATDDADLPRLPSGPSGQAALANHSWSYTTPSGAIDGWVLSEAFQPGSSAGAGHDGSDLFANLVGTQHVLDFVDVEITEAWYPLHVLGKAAAPGAHGAGCHRSGSGCRMAYRVSGDEHLAGAMFAMRESLPIGGVAGGQPGAPTEFVVHRADGRAVLDAHAAGATLAPGEVFEFQAGSGGGWGDPLDRDPDLVARDVQIGRLTREQAEATYGVVLVADAGPDDADAGAAVPADATATTDRRAAIRRERLAAATPAARPIAPGVAVDPDRPAAPLHHGIVRRGRLAVSVGTGAVLAVAPDHWTDGCPVLVEERETASGRRWLSRTYLDPLDGRALHVEAVPLDAPRSFTTAPRHWTDA
jgi:N-methylhydantoinase B